MSRAAVLLIGGANIDRKVKSATRIAMGTSNPAAAIEAHGGVARNIAENLARLGIPVSLATAVGADPAGANLLHRLAELGVDVSASVRVEGARSGSYTAVLQPEGEMLVALSDMAVMDQLTPEVLRARLDQQHALSALVFDLNLPAASVAALIENGCPHTPLLIAVAVSEPKMQRLPARLHGLSLLILNRGELAVRIGRAAPHAGDELIDACRLLQAQGVQDVIVTLGAQGAAYAGAEGVSGMLESPRREVVDVTGAGDAFAAGAVASLIDCPGDLLRACRFGQSLSQHALASNETVARDLTPALLSALTRRLDARA